MLKKPLEQDRFRAKAPRLPYLSYLIFSLSLSVYLYPFMRLFRGGDEATLVYGALRVTEGQIPLRDFFEVIGPGSFYWLAFFFKLFGTSFLASRMSVALT